MCLAFKSVPAIYSTASLLLFAFPHLVLLYFLTVAPSLHCTLSSYGPLLLLTPTEGILSLYLFSQGKNTQNFHRDQQHQTTI